MWWKQHKWKVILPVLAAAVLVFAFWYGGSAPGLHGWTAAVGTSTPAAASAPGETPEPSAPAAEQSQTMPGAPSAPPAPEEAPAGSAPAASTPAPPGPTGGPRPGGAQSGAAPQEKKPDAAAERPAASSTGGMQLDPETGKDQYLTDPVPEGKPLPVEPQDASVSDVARTCTLSVSCAAILDHMDWLDPEKTGLVPEDGVIFPAAQVTFYEGESVFNVLQREMKKAKIHMEFENTPIYNSAYIEGINNLYEFDCGELSGWMYKVNGWFPNYGCSRYALQDGDVVEWVYTCDLGNDVGGGWAASGG